MISRVRIENYKALRDVTLDLTPIHLLIGPNDSGKTSILEAIQALCRSVDFELSQAFVGAWQGRELVWQEEPDVVVTLAASVGDLEYGLSSSFASQGRRVITAAEKAVRGEHQFLGTEGAIHSLVRGLSVLGEPVRDQSVTDLANQVHDALSGVHYYRWNPRFLALPTAPDASRRFRMDPSGFGLALCLDDILGYDRERFTALETRFREIFPQVKSIKLIAEPAYRAPEDYAQQVPALQRADGKGIHFEFAGGGPLVRAEQASDGVLLVLAYLTLLHLPQPPRVILVEEPENGVHPRRLRDLLEILRELVGEQSRSQVIMTTHSPYVVDLFRPEEVSLCQRQPDGSVSVHRLSESRAVREQLSVFELGEIWTAEGDEALAKSAAENAGGAGE